MIETTFRNVKNNKPFFVAHSRLIKIKQISREDWVNKLISPNCYYENNEYIKNGTITFVLPNQCVTVESKDHILEIYEQPYRGN